MNASHILVVVLTLAAFAWLVWVELRSRRNAATEPTQEMTSAPDSQARRRKTR